jgi:hypothetical protein
MIVCRKWAAADALSLVCFGSQYFTLHPNPDAVSVICKKGDTGTVKRLANGFNAGLSRFCAPLKAVHSWRAI